MRNRYCYHHEKWEYPERGTAYVVNKELNEEAPEPRQIGFQIREESANVGQKDYKGDIVDE